MADDVAVLDGGAERFHDHDPADPTWNESWLVSWLPSEGRLAGLFRLGTLPNQGRAWLWLWLWTGEEWVTIEETRLAYDDLDRSDGVGYDRWGLSFSYRPTAPLEQGRFRIEGIGLVRSGRGRVRRVPVSVDLDLDGPHPVLHHRRRATTKGARPPRRPVRAVDGRRRLGRVGGVESPVECPAHRDRSWGPRTWQFPFMLGDLQSAERQIYFAGRPQRRGRRGQGLRPRGLATIVHPRHRSGRRWPTTTRPPPSAGRVCSSATSAAVSTPTTIEPIAPSVQFDMAHASDPPWHFLYWRTLVRATPLDGGEPVVGWFEANRFPYAGEPA